MGRNVTGAASASGTIADNIAGVAGAATMTAEGAVRSQQAAVRLAEMSAALRAKVTAFQL
jgi:methyl-accepting chemotaxis protein